MTVLMTVWTIYDHPKDFPTGYVVRPWHITAAGERPGDASYFASLLEARTSLPAGLFQLPRRPGDDPAVLECWI